MSHQFQPERWDPYAGALGIEDGIISVFREEKKAARLTESKRNNIGPPMPDSKVNALTPRVGIAGVLCLH